MTAMTKKAVLLFLAAGLLAGMSSCITEKRNVQFVVTNETCATFDVNENSENYVKTTYVFLADELDKALSDNDAAREDVVTARVVSVSYGVTQLPTNPPPHDWHITGAVTVERNDISDGPATLLNYTDESVRDSYGKHTPASLNRDGVEIINRAIDNYIAGGNPSLVFRLDNGAVSPVPTALDPIVFQWEPCMVLHIVVKKDIEVPDPF